MTIERKDIPAAGTLPVEVTTVADIGEVVVRGKGLSDGIAINWATRTDSAAVISVTLARCVLAGDGLPVYGVDEWDVYGSTHEAECVRLFQIVRRLSGEDEAELEKK